MKDFSNRVCRRYSVLKSTSKSWIFRIVCLLLIFISLSSTSRKNVIIDSLAQISVTKQYQSSQSSQKNPPPLSEIYPIVRPPNPQAPLPFTTPQLLSVYIRPRNNSALVQDLFVYASGINIGRFSRNLTVLGCLVGNTVYPTFATPYDIFRCTIPEPPSPDAAVSLLLHNNNVLQEALTFKTVTVRNVNITLPRGVLIDPPNDLKLMKKGQLVPIKSGSAKMLVSNITWSTFPAEKIPKNELESNPRYHICLMTMVKMFAESLKHWASYYRTIGVDKVFILDNLSNYSILGDFENREDVEVIYWPFDRSQVQGMSYMLQTVRARCEWIMQMDVDEFVMTGIEGSGGDKPLTWFLKDRARQGIQMSKFIYISLIGDRLEAATEPMPLAYTHLRMNLSVKRQGKSACRTDQDWALHTIHGCHLGGWPKAKSETIQGPREPSNVSDIPSTVHYKFRSWEEYSLKRKFGSSSTYDWQSKPSNAFNGDPPQWFKDFTKNAEKWTYFKDHYQTVMERFNEYEQTIVWKNGTRWCELKKNISTAWVGQEVCHEPHERFSS